MDRLEAMALAFAEHEKADHGAVDGRPIPDACLDDVARRFEELRVVEIANAVVEKLVAADAIGKGATDA